MLNFPVFMGERIIMFGPFLEEFNCEGQNEGNNGGIMRYNYGLDHGELGEQFFGVNNIRQTTYIL